MPDPKLIMARNVARVLTDAALADRLYRVVNHPRQFTIYERTAYVTEAADRLAKYGAK